jgi:nucleotidyltransferase/DNA polymerase involved in DNA repair
MNLYCVLLFPDFPARVAAAYDPRLRGTAYAVVRQSGESHKSVVWSVSRAAAQRGVRPGMPVAAARRVCAGIAIIAHNESFLEAARAELGAALARYSPAVAVRRSGSCELDLSRTPFSRTGRLHEQAAAMQGAVDRATGLGPPSIGIAASRLAAAIAARRAPESGILICPAGDEEELVASCDTAALPGLSAACRERLRKYGLRTVAQVQRLPKSDLVVRFGPEGERLHALSRGIDPGETVAAAKPVEVETVLERDSGDRALLLQYLRRTVDRFCYGLRVRRLTVLAARLAIRYTDNRRTQRTLQFRGGAEGYVALVTAMTAAFDALCVRRVGIKSILITGVRCERASGQTELFESAWDGKQRDLSAKIDEVRKRMHFDALFSGADQAVHALMNRRIVDSVANQ